MPAEWKVAAGAVAVAVALLCSALWAGGPLLELVAPRHHDAGEP